MTIHVLYPGLLTTLQDLGRVGYQKQGIIVSGAMDVYSMRLANLLVGNDEGEAALEVTLMGPKLKIDDDTLLAVTGGNLSPTIDGRILPMGRPVYVKAGSMIKFGACQSGCRTYLAVAGGYDVPKVMGSKSTYLRAGLGGFQGRALQKGDALSVQTPQEVSLRIIKHFVKQHSAASFVSTDWYAGRGQTAISPARTIRITRGRQFDQFTEASKNAFLTDSFRVTPQSDRMGYRLSGEVLKLAHQVEMISEGITLGAIQVPPDGQPIILLADRQTAGGYPKLAQVIAVDVAVIAQSKPGSLLSFQEVSVAEAEKLYLAKEQAFAQLKAAVSLKLQS
jgi:antagonist of KipI